MMSQTKVYHGKLMLGCQTSGYWVVIPCRGCLFIHNCPLGEYEICKQYARQVAEWFRNIWGGLSEPLWPLTKEFGRNERV